MHINLRWLLLFFLLLGVCLLVTDGKGGRGGSRGGGSRSRGSSSSSSRRRPTYRPAPARPSPRPPAYKPSPMPAPKPTPRMTQRPQPPSPRPTQRPAPPASPKPSGPENPVVVKQPGTNPDFKETNPVQGSANKQPAYNPNYKPEGGAPGGPPPPYSPAGHPAPSAPVGPPPPYQPNAPGRAPYPQQPGVQPPPYPGLPGRPPAYPGQSAPYPQQPGYPGSYPQQPGYPGSYPRQPGYPGSYPQQPGMNRPYPVQPGYPQYPGGNRPYPQQPLGGNVWQPQSGRPAPAYMNYGGIPTGSNIYTKPHKQKGFLGSLMSMGSHKTPKTNKYYGSYPSPYGVGRHGGGGLGAMGGGFLGKHGKSAAMYTILPYMAYKTAPKIFRPRFPSLMFLPLFLPRPYFHHHHHYGHGMYGMNSEYAHYYDVYNNDYVGKCQRPLKKEHTDIRCKTTYDDIKCDAKCEDGFAFPENITLRSNRCWHVTGVWRPNKNFPICKPICEDDCVNGGECIRPGVCKCPAEFRGDRCQFRKLNFLDCDIRKLTKNERNVGWVCKHFKNQTECNIRCKDPAKFESPAAEVYRCIPTGTWTPDSIPRCIVKDEKDGNSTTT